jgi:ectoine hydroxylase-related dioxygenase (phytanoyl-CoA dioxygenase family)
MLLFKDKINYKSVRANGFKPHIDAPGYDHVGKIEHLTANFAVDPANAENGCLEVVPGSHKMEVDLVHVAQISDAWEAAHEWVPVNLEAGDLLLFGSFLAHRSKPNLSEKPRASIYATYHGRADGEDLRQKYYAHRRIAFPPDHGK